MALRTPRVLVVGGGAAGLEAARRLERSGVDIDLTVVDLDGIHVYQPLLPEVASGMMEPRHAVVPLRSALRSATVLDGEAIALDAGLQMLRVRRPDDSEVELPYDHLVVAPGSITNVMPIPGLIGRAVGFATVGEALHLRDRVLDRMQLADSSDDTARRRRALTFVFVGAGYSGVEAVGELRDMAVDAAAEFAKVSPEDLRFVLVEATSTILPMVGPTLRDAAMRDLERRHIELRLDTLVESVDDTAVHLSDGTALASDTIVWCAGSRPDPAVEALGLPLTEDGAVEVDETLAVPAMRGVWAAGDCAAVPIDGGTRRAPASAQFAVREGRHIASNVVAVARGDRPRPFRYRQRGELITLGRRSAVGEVFGVPITGTPAWVLRAVYHLARFPTVRRRSRTAIDWAVNLAFPREITSLGSARDPSRPLVDAALATDPAGTDPEE